jgi:hypothetical protein
MQLINKQSYQAKPTTCRIISKKSKKVLSFSNDSETTGVVVLKEDRRDPNEYFRLIPEGTHFLIQSAFNGQYLSVYRASRRAGTGLVSLEHYGVESEHFFLKPTANGNG